jgi:decaprenyl-phosphate phosphoribosyltransferase
VSNPTPERPWRRSGPPAFHPRVVPAPQALLPAVVRTLRPRQWVKNVLVFAAPAAAGVLTHRDALLYSVAAFVVFCLAASGMYCLNDVIDLEADRRHPVKRNRPVASGVVPTRLAVLVGSGLLIVALAAAAAIGRPKLALVVAIYVAVQVAYTLWLKHEAILDLAAVAAGFVLRAIAGGVATQVPLSNWFLIVACFGSLFMVTGKREAEIMLLGQDGEHHRATLGAYTPTFLRYVRAVTSGVAMTAYCLWAFERAHGSAGAIWFELSIVPFVLGVLRYALLVDAGHGGAPEDVVLGDPTLQVLALSLAVLFAIGVYR